jgi:hypothetical protein
MESRTVPRGHADLVVCGIVPGIVPATADLVGIADLVDAAALRDGTVVGDDSRARADAPLGVVGIAAAAVTGASDQREKSCNDKRALGQTARTGPAWNPTSKHTRHSTCPKRTTHPRTDQAPTSTQRAWPKLAVIVARVGIQNVNGLPGAPQGRGRAGQISGREGHLRSRILVWTGTARLQHRCKALQGQGVAGAILRVARRAYRVAAVPAPATEDQDRRGLWSMKTGVDKEWGR